MQIGIITQINQPELIQAVERAGMNPIEFLAEDHLAEMDGYILADNQISASQLKVIKEQNELGKPILGIAKGAQILVMAGLVPGVEDNQPAMSFIEGTSTDSAWVNIRVSDEYQYGAFTRLLNPKIILSLPIIGDSHFKISPALLIEMQMNGLNVFQYCDSEEVAAVSNKAGNVLAMIPHPEKSLAGDLIFQSMRDYIEKGYRQKVTPLHYYPRT